MIRYTLVIALTVVAAAEPTHSVAFWRQIAQNKYVVPTDSDLGGLTRELTTMLGSPDPEVRDEIAYGTLANWIYQSRVLDPGALRALAAILLANLKEGIGERGTDRIFRRSFSALTLSVVAARDNVAPFLDAPEFRRIYDASLVYLEAERDLRGYDPEHGWMHAAAHTADLLKFLARSRFLDPPEQGRLLDAIARKFTTAPAVFTHGEDERFARAVLSIVNRRDFDREVFSSWTSRLRPPRLPAKPTAIELSSGQNAKNLLAKLLVLLDADGQPSDGVQTARESVRAALKEAF